MRRFIVSLVALALGAFAVSSCLGESYSRTSYSFNPDYAFAVKIDSVKQSGKTFYRTRLILTTEQVDSAGFLAKPGSMVSLLLVNSKPDSLMCGTYTTLSSDTLKNFTFIPCYIEKDTLKGSFWEIYNLGSVPQCYGMNAGSVSITNATDGKQKVSATSTISDITFNTSYDGKIPFTDSLDFKLY